MLDRSGVLRAVPVPLSAESYSSPGVYDISQTKCLSLSVGVSKLSIVRDADVAPLIVVLPSAPFVNSRTETMDELGGD